MESNEKTRVEKIEDLAKSLEKDSISKEQFENEKKKVLSTGPKGKARKKRMIVFFTVLFASIFVMCGGCGALVFLTPDYEEPPINQNTTDPKPRPPVETNDPIVEEEAPPVEAPQPSGLMTPSEFEKTSFYNEYKFDKDSPYEFDNGVVSYGYFSDEFGSGLTGLDINTKGGEVISWSVSFYSNEGLSEGEKAMVREMISLASREEDVTEPYSFAVTNAHVFVNDPNKSVNDTVPLSWKGLNIYAAQIGYSSRHIVIENQ